MDKINLFLKENYKEKTLYGGRIYPIPTKRIECEDGYSISVQAHEYAYCAPRENRAWPYNEVELGYPSESDELINGYAEEGNDYTDTVYPYVPIDIVNELIEKHGGIKEF